MKVFPTISVIIPTHNRKDSLLRLLQSVAQQTFPMDRLEVIVVDDGSSDDTPTIAGQRFPFTFRYLQQKNQGATAARNLGAKSSQSEILVFIDDDITISTLTLEAFAEKLCQTTNILTMGTIIKRSSKDASVYTSVALTMADHTLMARDNLEINAVDCNSELLACKRQDFFDIGMFQDPTEGHGWPNWDDVDFGYRAYLKGYRLVGTAQASADHWDYSILDREAASNRSYRAARSAVWLFNKHPELQARIPMLRDKAPLNWRQDSILLIARKLVRQLISSQPVQSIMNRLVGILEQRYPSPRILRRLYYLVEGANLFHGYRAGLGEFRRAGVQS